MKVLNLQCSRQHSFEGWFGSEEDFRNQLTRGLIECPLCADKEIQKLPSAPRLNFGGHQTSGSASMGHGQAVPSASTAMTPLENPDWTRREHAMGLPDGMPRSEQAACLKAVRHVFAHTEDVGQRFDAVGDERLRMSGHAGGDFAGGEKRIDDDPEAGRPHAFAQPTVRLVRRICHGHGARLTAHGVSVFSFRFEVSRLFALLVKRLTELPASGEE